MKNKRSHSHLVPNLHGNGHDHGHDHKHDHGHSNGDGHDHDHSHEPCHDFTIDQTRFDDLIEKVQEHDESKVL